MTGSLWEETAGPGPTGGQGDRSPLDGDRRVDVAIVGAGYTGLWTAYYLSAAEPGLDIAVFERERVGFGASGRNGGWCIGELAASYDVLRRAGGAVAARGQIRAMFDAVDEVGRVTAAEAIECDFVKGGALRLARNRPQLDRLRAEVEHARDEVGLDDGDLRLLDQDEAEAELAATSVLGGVHFAHTAALHPRKLVDGLAAAVERRGVRIHEATEVSALAPGEVVTRRGRVSASFVVRATEGYTGSLRRHRRHLLPLYSLMVATEPLSPDVWQSIGLDGRATFADDRHLVIYGQRTADGRIAFGGRGAAYGYGSRIDPAIEQRSATHDVIIETLHELLPQVSGAEITHRWGGVLGVPRDWRPSVGFDEASGTAWGGGYVGEGVAAANLAGRTLAELIIGEDTERTDLPWVDHRSRRWEPEPFRWLGVNGALRLMGSADRIETEKGRPARRARLLDRLTG